jgi:hypothetical protein
MVQATAPSQHSTKMATNDVDQGSASAVSTAKKSAIAAQIAGSRQNRSTIAAGENDALALTFDMRGQAGSRTLGYAGAR